MGYIFDIIVVGLLLWSFWRGYRKGIIPQLGAIVGLVAGVALAYFVGDQAASFIGVTSGAGVMFTCIGIAVAVMIVVTLVAGALSNATDATGLGWLNGWGGGLLSALKTAVVMSLMLWGFEALNERHRMVSHEKLEATCFFCPLLHMTNYVFPFIDMARDQAGKWKDTDNKNNN